MLTSLLFTGILALICEAKQFRFDYVFSDEAGGWLKYHVIPTTWDEARLICHAEGAVLASPLNEKIKTAILSYLAQQKGTKPTIIFTGVHASFFKGIYSSIEGVPLLRLAITWAEGEPDNFENSESCLAMQVNKNGVMMDTRCDAVLPFVCYKKETQLAITKCGTTDPEYFLDYITGSCYKLHSTGLAWSLAYMTCVSEGGYLAIIDDEVEARVLTEIINEPLKYDSTPVPIEVFVGFHDWGHYGSNFMTIHGDSLKDVFHKWGEHQPDNGTSPLYGDKGQYCGAFFKAGLIDDMFCNAPTKFVCEKDPNSLN